jgi:hypothetical protein
MLKQYTSMPRGDIDGPNLNGRFFVRRARCTANGQIVFGTNAMEGMRFKLATGRRPAGMGRPQFTLVRSHHPQTVPFP